MSRPRKWGRNKPPAREKGEALEPPASSAPPEQVEPVVRSSGVFASPPPDDDATASGSSRETGQEAPMRPRKRRALDIPLPTIVIVDDKPEAFRTWRIWFDNRFAEHPLVWATNLDEARAALKASPVIAVILDIWLGKEDGRDLLREMRAAGDHTPVLVVTGDENLAYLSETVRLDAQLLFKPFPEADVKTFIEHSIARPRTMRVLATLAAMEWELTTTEAETLTSFLCGLSLKSIAEARGVARATVENQMQVVLNKTKVGSQVELYHLLVGRICPPDHG